MAINKKN